jgi:DNA-binding LacI/PurR family transcriptional regulator
VTTDTKKRRVDRQTRSMAINMGDIARLANVSKPTVSRALNNSPLVTPETRERVLDVARAHGYAVNRNAQRLRQVRTDTVAVVLDFGSHRAGRIADPFIFELLAGVSEALSIRNQDLLLSPPGLTDAKSCLQMLAARAADGFIFLGQGGREPMLNELARSGAPFVVWGAVDMAGPYCAVGSDNALGGRLAGELFLKRGAKRWLFVGDSEHKEIRMRLDGLRTAAQDAKASVTIDALSVEHMAYAATHASAAGYLREHHAPDAVFAFSDTAAMAVLAAFREAGLTAPDDFSICGYNNIPPAADFTPAITTIEQETQIAGSILVEKLMQLIDGGRSRSTTLPTRLIERET